MSALWPLGKDTPATQHNGQAPRQECAPCVCSKKTAVVGGDEGAEKGKSGRGKEQIV